MRRAILLQTGREQFLMAEMQHAVLRTRYDEGRVRKCIKLQMIPRLFNS